MGFRGSVADGPLFISAHIVIIIIMILMRDALARSRAVLISPFKRKIIITSLPLFGKKKEKMLLL
jgi:hypothetical protein